MAELTENLVRLRSVHGVGSVILWRLIRAFGNSDSILGAGAAELGRIKGVSAALAERILAAGSFDPRPEMEKAVQAGISIIPYDDAEYPQPLLHSFDPPVVLYVRGRLTAADQVAVGVVGTRNMSPYGRQKAMELSAALARGGYTIVSGLAKGVDTFAHFGALNARGRTIGVLGCGFDHMYPEENRDLAVEMTQSGAVITEFSMATRPSRDTFPTRNRIIAGMSLGVLVIEAPVRSGALITARLANEIGRSVFAVPGRMDDARSEGCNKLIRDGAVMVTTVDDIFIELNPSLSLPKLPERKKKGQEEKVPEKDSVPAKRLFPDEERRKPEPVAVVRPVVELTEEQSRVFEMVGEEWRTVDDVIDMSGVAAGKVTAVLALLKLKRLVDQGPGQTYKRR